MHGADDQMRQRIALGGGCFWCTEAVFRKVGGIDVTPGYAGGDKADPTYEEVCRGDTGHAEVVLLEYDDKDISTRYILDLFFRAHDPTQLDRQGNDVGSQYRSVILYSDEGQRREAKEAIERAAKDHDRPIVTEVKSLDMFYPAEDYHHEYYERNKLNPYCMFVIYPKMQKIEKMIGKEKAEQGS